MANLGNTWHIPGNAEPRNLAGMRSPIGRVASGATLTICCGNQFQGGGNPGNQLQDGSVLRFRRAGDPNWQTSPLVFREQLDNNKYFVGVIAANTFRTGDVVQYYLQVAYDDHDLTFVFRNGDFSATTEVEATARATPFTLTIADHAEIGEWGPVFTLPNVAAHAHLLPNGRVLMWGRRDNPGDSLDEHVCTPFVWDPSNGTTAMTAQPRDARGNTVNLFCSGHTFLPDGRLLVVGGHWADGDGLSQAALFDYRTSAWTPSAPMTAPDGAEVRRWYPTATTLPNGTVLVLSGSYLDPNKPQSRQQTPVDLLQIWNNGAWQTIPTAGGGALNFVGLPLYPRMHVSGNGGVFMSGLLDRTLSLKTDAPGAWTVVAFRSLGGRDYCPAVMYDADKILYIGGGNDVDTKLPSADVELIDLAVAAPQWRRTGSMRNRRRQHNATVLPDGSVLVTGGTRGGGGPNDGFNDLAAGQPVHMAELWNASTETWTELSAEDVPRCYHAVAVLLPDATVLSAGGGEYRPDNINENAPQDSHRNAQRFSPPYLFKGPRPRITAAPQSIRHAQQFRIETPQAARIAKVSCIALASVTHSFDEHQHASFLAFTSDAAGLTVTAPASTNACPPGPYMVFVVDDDGVPSQAAIVSVQPQVAPPVAAIRFEALASTVPAAAKPELPLYSSAAYAPATPKGTAVLVGITGTCPYGIGACWGGAHEALGRLEAVDAVSPIPDTEDSTATVFLSGDRLPPIALWQQQFRRIVNGSYVLRGVEVSLVGRVELRDGELHLAATASRPALRLDPLAADAKLQWNHQALSRKPLEPGEGEAHERLLADTSRHGGQLSATVTGPLVHSDAAGYALLVRRVSLA